jgi:hypothetical protein
MHHRALSAIALLLALLLLPWTAAAALAPELQQGLSQSKFVYISSTRKDGSLSRPAEIWFLFHDGAVYVGTRPASWRVRRIKAGRSDAKIAVGTAGGPSFMATGSVVTDAAAQELMLKTFAQKYPDRWASHEQSFREGFKDGSRVLVRYVPKN